MKARHEELIPWNFGEEMNAAFCSKHIYDKPLRDLDLGQDFEMGGDWSELPFARDQDGYSWDSSHPSGNSQKNWGKMRQNGTNQYQVGNLLKVS